MSSSPQRSESPTSLALTGPVIGGGQSAADRRLSAIVTRALQNLNDGPIAAPETRPTGGAEAVERTMGQLFPNRTPLRYHGLVTRDLQNFHVRSVVAPVVARLEAAIVNQRLLYVHGKERRIGTSTLLRDFSRAFNFAAGEAGDDRRILYLQVPFQTKSVKAFLDMVADELNDNLTLAELRFRGTKVLLGDIVATMRSNRIVLVIIDHVEFFDNKNVLPFLAELIVELDPSLRRVPRDRRAFDMPQERIGLVLASSKAPSSLLASLAAVRGPLGKNVVTMRAFLNDTEVGEAMRLAEIGLHDLDLSRQDDALMAERVYEQTKGNAEAINQLLVIVDALAREDGSRPTLATIDEAVTFYDPDPDGDGMVTLGKKGPPKSPTLPAVNATSQTADDPLMTSDEAPRSSEAAQMLKRADANREGHQKLAAEVLGSKR